MIPMSLLMNLLALAGVAHLTGTPKSQFLDFFPLDAYSRTQIVNFFVISPSGWLQGPGIRVLDGFLLHYYPIQCPI